MHLSHCIYNHTHTLFLTENADIRAFQADFSQVFTPRPIFSRDVKSSAKLITGNCASLFSWVLYHSDNLYYLSRHVFKAWLPYFHFPFFKPYSKCSLEKVFSYEYIWILVLASISFGALWHFYVCLNLSYCKNRLKNKFQTSFMGIYKSQVFSL